MLDDDDMEANVHESFSSSELSVNRGLLSRKCYMFNFS